MVEKTRLETVKKAFILMLYGIEPTMGENIDDYVRRGERMIRRKLGEERYVEKNA